MGSYIPTACDALDFNLDGSYIIPSCDALNFSIGGDADPEVLSHDIEIFLSSSVMEMTIAEVIETDSLSVQVETEHALIEPLVHIGADSSSISIEYNQPPIEILPDIVVSSMYVEIESTTAVTKTPEPQNLPTDTSVSGRVYSWGSGNVSDDTIGFPFGDGATINTQIWVPVKEQALPDASTNCSWVTQSGKDHVIATPYMIFQEGALNVSTSSPWISMMDHIDHSPNSPWGGLQEVVDVHFWTPYNEPGAHDILKHTVWDTPKDYDVTLTTPYDIPGQHDVKHCTVWGPYSYYTLCNKMSGYVPPRACTEILFKFPSKYPLIANVCEDIVFELDDYQSKKDPRCPFNHQHSGVRDKYQGIDVTVPPEGQPYPSSQQVYYMLNQVLVKEYITGTPIEVLGVSATIDRDSWLWQFQVTVSSRDCLEVIKPTQASLKTIEITINGYVWLCTVEGWSENRAFGNDAWTVTGRSPSMLLGDPVNTKYSHTETAAAQGGQLLDQALARNNAPEGWNPNLTTWNTDWSAFSRSTLIGADYGTALNTTGFDPFGSWLVPEDTFSYSGQNTIQAMQSVSGAIGAYMQTEPDADGFGKNIYVKPMYPQAPWNWNSDNNDISWKPLIEDQFIEVSRSFDPKPSYDAVYVVGEAVGGDNDGTGNTGHTDAICASVHHANVGTGAADFAPMITNNLVTSLPSATELGRVAIYQTREWVRHTLRLNVLCFDSTSAGLYKVGDMITVMERGFPWYGQVTGVSVAVAGSGTGFSVSQVINVEQFIGKEPGTV